MKYIYKSLLLLIILMSGVQLLQAKTVKYTLTLSKTIETINNQKVIRYLINNSKNAPVIKAAKEDTLVIKVVNNTDIETTIHWHGVLVPNNMDGSPVTQAPIKRGSNFTYTFVVKQTGTYWYHAHGLEEASGIYGGIIFNDSSNSIPEGNLLVYSGEADQEPAAILKDLTTNSLAGGSTDGNTESDRATSIEKHSMKGHNMSGQSMQNSCQKRSNKGMGMCNMMHGYSDVRFAKQVINGSDQPILIKPTLNNNKIKLRIVNAYSDGYLRFVYSGGPITVIAADGLDVKPIKVKSLQVAMGETYDIELIVPNKTKSYELIAFVLDTRAYSKVIINKGKAVTLTNYNASDYKDSNIYSKLQTINYDFLNFNKYNAQKDYNLYLKGDHANYKWSIVDKNGKAVDLIKIKEGTKVVMTIANNSPMPHPMHLHGFFFKVVDSKGNKTLIKHTLNINPMQQVKIEFIADQQGKWLMHCHNLFHMASGMTTTIEVTDP